LVLHLLLPPMVAWQLRAAQSLLFATAVCHEVAVVTPSQFDSVIELFLPLWKLGRKTASAGGQVKSSRLRNPNHQARRICREGEAREIMQVGGLHYKNTSRSPTVQRFDMLLITRGCHRMQFNSPIYPDVRNTSFFDSFASLELHCRI
jgi:hypothetical protein